MKKSARIVKKNLTAYNKSYKPKCQFFECKNFGWFDHRYRFYCRKHWSAVQDISYYWHERTRGRV